MTRPTAEVDHRSGTRFYKGRVILVLSECDHNHRDPDVARRCATQQLCDIENQPHKMRTVIDSWLWPRAKHEATGQEK